eukprot:5311990-Pyramimonas_sp.AAC.1
MSGIWQRHKQRLLDGVRVHRVKGSHRIAGTAMHRRRRRCIGDVGAKQIGRRVEPHRRCIGDAARSSDPVYSDPI